MTGPSGNQNDFTGGFTGSLLAPRVLIFLLAGAAIAGVATLARHNQFSATERLAPLAAARSRLVASRGRRYAIYLVLLVLAVLLPEILQPFWQRVLVDQIGIFVLLALGLNVVVGYAGLLDLGYIAFFAIGAYTTAYFTGALPVHPIFHLNPFLVLPVAVIACLIAGVVLGGPTLRLRGDYLAIVTLGFGEIVRITAVNSDKITNGPRGAFGIPHFSLHLLGINYKWTLNSVPYYYLLLVFVIGVMIALNRLENSRVGRAWTAIREDEVAAAATGVPTLRFKLLAFAIGASTSGFAGVLYASKIGVVSPDNFPLTLSILVLVLVIFGGMGSLPGVVIGAAVLQWLPNVLRDRVPPPDRPIYFGALLIVMMIFRPQGIIPSRRRSREIAMAEAGIGSADSLGPTPGAA
jgi:branched-chain amino acid transport system permease protein